ncbi:hypothetical protein [Campylobacter lanienae]|uniref:hypothetical protein n=1 Tax=Campylobacter lanienae TaxID=75658 RepID=UPI000BB3FA10|nr:hypothetical protein [Campylobacter lanienae]
MPILSTLEGQNNRFWNNKFCALAWLSSNVYYQNWLNLGSSAYENGFVSFLEAPESSVGKCFGILKKLL